MALVADDFIFPHWAVDIDEESAVADLRGLRMRGDVGVDQRVPGLHDFRFRLFLLEVEVLENFVHELARTGDIVDPLLVEGWIVNPAPVGEDLILGGPARGADLGFAKRERIHE